MSDYRALSLAAVAAALLAYGYKKYRKWRKMTLTEQTLKADLALFPKIFDLHQMQTRGQETADVARYYRFSSQREYVVMGRLLGNIAMHTFLIPQEGWEPFRLGTFKQLLYVLLHLEGTKAAQGGLRVLEVGFGKGQNTIALASYLPNVEFYGLDLLPQHKLVAEGYASQVVPNVLNHTHFITGNVLDIPAELKGIKFDLIFAVEVFCYLDTAEKLQRFLQYASSALTEQGKVVTADFFSADKNTGPLSHELSEALKWAETGFAIQHYASKREWQIHGEQCGFRVVDDVDLTSDAIRFWRHGWRLTRFFLGFPTLSKWLFRRSPLWRETAGSTIAVMCFAYCLQFGAAEYGVLVLQKVGPVQ